MTTSLPTIALAEDEPDLRDAVAEFLESAGFRVIAAGNGADLRDAVAGQHIDVALLDIVMPGEDGLSLARWLRAKGPVGVIMTTALGRPIDRVVGLDHGADDYLVKPYDLRELLARIRSVLRRQSGGVVIAAPAPAPADLPGGALRIDREHRAVSDAHGISVTLSEAEFTVIAALVARRGRLVTRDELAAATGISGDPRNVDVRIARLRKKLSVLDGGEAALATVRGEGYRLDNVAG